jgi:hypothetical protein
MYREGPDYVVSEQPSVVHEDRGAGLTGYAFVKYAFILAITIVVLYFVARFLLPLVNGNS